MQAQLTWKIPTGGGSSPSDPLSSLASADDIGTVGASAPSAAPERSQAPAAASSAADGGSERPLPGSNAPTPATSTREMVETLVPSPPPETASVPEITPTPSPEPVSQPEPNPSPESPEQPSTEQQPPLQSEPQPEIQSDPPVEAPSSSPAPAPSPTVEEPQPEEPSATADPELTLGPSPAPPAEGTECTASAALDAAEPDPIVTGEPEPSRASEGDPSAETNTVPTEPQPAAATGEAPPTSQPSVVVPPGGVIAGATDNGHSSSSGLPADARSGGSSLGPILGAVLGGIALLILMGVLLFLCWRRGWLPLGGRRSPGSRSKTRSPNMSEAGLTGGVSVSRGPSDAGLYSNRTTTPGSSAGHDAAVTPAYVSGGYGTDFGRYEEADLSEEFVDHAALSTAQYGGHSALPVAAAFQYSAYYGAGGPGESIPFAHQARPEWNGREPVPPSNSAHRNHTTGPTGPAVSLPPLPPASTRPPSSGLLPHDVHMSGGVVVITAGSPPGQGLGGPQRISICGTRHSWGAVAATAHVQPGDGHEYGAHPYGIRHSIPSPPWHAQHPPSDGNDNSTDSLHALPTNPLAHGYAHAPAHASGPVPPIPEVPSQWEWERPRFPRPDSGGASVRTTGTSGTGTTDE